MKRLHHLTSDSTGSIYLNNDILNSNVSLNSINIYAGRNGVALTFGFCWAIGKKADL